ncbi:MAG: allophanate hydrolase [Actinomycetota bacterium]
MTALEAARAAIAAIGEIDDPAVFISVADDALIDPWAASVDDRPGDEVPLRGRVVAAKDNVDVVGLATTSACPSASYEPERSATVIERLLAAGAVPVAKTNMDQFATGLVGTRSPHGTPRNPVDPGLIPGGSSSGSAVAVARGLVDIGIGTDTAGSGRVPAALCGVVGFKPTVGRVPTGGVVPAVRTVDCVSFFTPSVEAARNLVPIVSGPDDRDPFAVAGPSSPPLVVAPSMAVASLDQLASAGAAHATVAAYDAVLDRLRRAGMALDEVDLGPLFAIGDLLYGGPMVAERLAAVEPHLAAGGGDLDPVVAEVIGGGARFSAVDAHRATYRLAELRAGPPSTMLRSGRTLLLPTIPFAPSPADVAADPIGVNSALGRFTTFANLLGWCAVAVPVRDVAPPPFGVTVFAPAWHDEHALDVAAAVQHGGAPPSPAGGVRLAVAGAHLRGQPLAHQLEERGAVWEGTTSTAAEYRLFALPGGPPFKPALVNDAAGTSIEVDVWRLDDAALGSFLQLIPAPLALGTVSLADGSHTVGFVSEPRATEGATEITHYGGWRAFVTDQG